MVCPANRTGHLMFYERTTEGDRGRWRQDWSTEGGSPEICLMKDCQMGPFWWSQVNLIWFFAPLSSYRSLSLAAIIQMRCLLFSTGTRPNLFLWWVQGPFLEFKLLRARATFLKERNCQNAASPAVSVTLTISGPHAQGQRVSCVLSPVFSSTVQFAVGLILW